MDKLTIAGLAREAGVNVETIRFYQRRRLLTEPPKPAAGFRHYGADAVARVCFIKSAQRLGFSLGEIEQLLKLEDGTHCREARQIAEQKIVDIRSRLADLQRIEVTLAALVRRCAAARGKITCPLIDTMRGP